jgi:hypothetical protein
MSEPWWGYDNEWQEGTVTHKISCRKRDSDAHKLNYRETVFSRLQVHCNAWARRQLVAAESSGQSSRLGGFIVATADWVHKYLLTQNYKTLFVQKCIKWNNESKQIRYVGFEVFTAVTMKNAISHAGSSLADFSTLKMEVIHSSETSIHTRSTRRHILEYDIFQITCGVLSNFPNSCSYSLSYIFFYLNIFKDFISMKTQGEP